MIVEYWAKPWGIVKLVRQQILILLFAGPNPATPTKNLQKNDLKWVDKPKIKF